MERTITTRREFVKLAAVASAFPFLLNCRTDTSALVSNGKLLEAIKANSDPDPRDSYWGLKMVKGIDGMLRGVRDIRLWV